MLTLSRNHWEAVPIPKPSGSQTTYHRLFNFFLPLAFQAFSASLTYPLVAMVASQGPGGALNHAGMGQAQTIMFFIGNIFGSGLLTCGMVYGRTRDGFKQFCRVNRMVAIIIVALQLVFCIPVISHILYHRFIGLPPSIEAISARVLLYSIPLNILFYIRNPFQVALYNNLDTGKPSFAAIMRIVVTMALSPLFVVLKLVGPFWATVCLTVPTMLEVAFDWYFSRTIIAHLPDGESKPIRLQEVLQFNAVLSIGGGLIWLSQLILGSFIVRSPEPERIVPIYYVTAGIVNSLAAGVQRIQSVSLTFPPKRKSDTTTLKFAIAVGLMFGIVVLILRIPPLAEWYFVRIQRLKESDLPLVYQTVLLFSLFPVTVCLRSRIEGLIAYKKKSALFLGGQAIYTGLLTLIGLGLCALKTSGNLLGPLGFILANLTTAALLHFILRSKRALNKFKSNVLWARAIWHSKTE